MSWFYTLLNQKQCLTRVLERDYKYIAQVRYAFFWIELISEFEQEYDYGNEYEENYRRLQKVRDHAAQYARSHKGYYLGTVRYESLRDKISAKLRAKFTGPCGMQGAKGDMGTPGKQGPRGRSFDDIQCPHCETYRTDIHPSVALHFDHFGDDVPLVYTCKFSKCGRQSNWIAYNGMFLHVGTITQHAVGDDAKPTAPDSELS